MDSTLFDWSELLIRFWFYDKSLELFLTECRKTKTKAIPYQLDYSVNLKPKQNQNQEIAWFEM